MAERCTFLELGEHSIIAKAKNGRTLPPKTNQPTKIIEAYLRAKKSTDMCKKKGSFLLTQ